MSQRSVALFALIAAGVLAAVPSTASATYPGQNGQIAYAQAKYDKKAKEFSYFGPGALFTVLPDGSAATALPDDPSYDDYEPSWSPDGTQIAYVSVGGSKYDGIYANTLGTNRLRRLAKANAPDGPVWAPDGTSVTYVDYSKGIYSVKATAGAKPQLVLRNTKAFTLSAPAYSADGTTLFFVRQYAPTGDPTAPIAEVWAADQGGSNPRKIAGGAGDLQNVGEPDVSPDSKQLVLATFKVGANPGGLWITNVDGSGARKLLASPSNGFYSGPSWSPDGTTIVACLLYGSIKRGSALVLIDPATGATKILRKARKKYMGTVRWQPVLAATPAS